MYPVVDDPASCEFRSVIRFIQAKNFIVAKLHHELRAAVCGQNMLSERTVKHWCKMNVKFLCRLQEIPFLCLLQPTLLFAWNLYPFFSFSVSHLRMSQIQRL
jgi:hypothetical protein